MDLLARLTQHRALGQAPAVEHAWLAAHGTMRRYEIGDVVTHKGAQADSLLVFFSGHVVIRLDRGAGAHKIFEWRGGDVGGTMPYSRGASPPSDAVAEEPTEALAIAKAQLPELIHACPVITATLVHVMVDRAREFTTSALRDEKLISLGKLAAGVAHELNNPAAAVVRSAKLLVASIRDAEGAGRKLCAAHLSDVQLTAIDAVRASCTLPALRKSGAFSPLALADNEEALARWFSAHAIDESAAAALADTRVTLEELDRLAASVTGEALEAAVQWLAAGCLVRSLSAEIEAAASRISGLVAAVKGFSYMDRAPTPEPVDIRVGIADTLTVLGAKVRAKSVEVSVDIPPDLPRVQGVGVELNQVWMNLLDNALDAVAAGGQVAVSAAPELNCVTVRVRDNGPGIPPEILGRIFDPFFTTKPVGKGTGLGLDIVRRLLQSHSGEIAVESTPGRTEFQVRLPAA
ncbi:MAG TPA: ATP-binding protein [Gemmatimonadales bacterium]|nr:ATP-binding protein [Gemmatimonadales bacterium]